MDRTPYTRTSSSASAALKPAPPGAHVQHEIPDGSQQTFYDGPFAGRWVVERVSGRTDARSVYQRVRDSESAVDAAQPAPELQYPTRGLKPKVRRAYSRKLTSAETRTRSLEQPRDADRGHSNFAENSPRPTGRPTGWTRAGVRPHGR
jgi:hypothetical protein